MFLIDDIKSNYHKSFRKINHEMKSSICNHTRVENYGKTNDIYDTSSLLISFFNSLSNLNLKISFISNKHYLHHTLIFC